MIMRDVFWGRGEYWQGCQWWCQESHLVHDCWKGRQVLWLGHLVLWLGGSSRVHCGRALFCLVGPTPPVEESRPLSHTLDYVLSFASLIHLKVAHSHQRTHSDSQHSSTREYQWLTCWRGGQWLDWVEWHKWRH